MSLTNLGQPGFMENATGAVMQIDGCEYSYFGGTSYYELHRNPDVVNAAIESLKKYGITSSSSRNSFGTTQLILDLEKVAAEFLNSESSAYLPSGFLTDSAAIQALVNRNTFDIIFIDEISHHSNEYAARISGKPIYKFSHLDELDLESKLKKHLLPNQKPLIITDGIFPVYGEITPIDKYKVLVDKYEGILWVDDAHALGVLGEHGRGSFEHYKLNSENIYFGGTFSKAFGGYGGIIPGNKEFIDEIKNNQIFTGSTPAPSSAIAASLTGLRIFQSNPEMKVKLWENAERLKAGLNSLGINAGHTAVPIVAWAMPNENAMKNIRDTLMKKNIMIQFMKYIGTSDAGVLRVVVFSSHTFDQIDNLVSELRKII